jgi:small nuclear ribonucleoprotein (snRNP)-like protein
MRINELKEFVDTTVTLRTRDGETAKVKVNFVDEEYENIVALVVETSCPEHRRAPCAIYTFAAEAIASAELSQ